MDNKRSITIKWIHSKYCLGELNSKKIIIEKMIRYITSKGKITKRIYFRKFTCKVVTRASLKERKVYQSRMLLRLNCFN